MGCFHPMTAFRSREVNEATGNRPLVFNHRGAEWLDKDRVVIPCGQCIGCRLERSRQWAIRCMHEKRMHDYNWFVTLTYDDENLPAGGGLVKRDLQLFMKRLRKKFGSGVRFYACGEYGGESARPHYHLLLFNCNLPDLRYNRKSATAGDLYSCAILDDLWPYGFSLVGEVTFESCAYVARYICDKITGDGADDWYLNWETGEICEPEFTVMSRRPGIGIDWYRKYGAHAHAHDAVIMRGRKMRPPRFYDTKLDKALLSVLKMKRRSVALRSRDDNTPERRRVKERLAQLTLLKKTEV